MQVNAKSAIRFVSAGKGNSSRSSILSPARSPNSWRAVPDTRRTAQVGKDQQVRNGGRVTVQNHCQITVCMAGHADRRPKTRPRSSANAQRRTAAPIPNPDRSAEIHPSDGEDRPAPRLAAGLVQAPPKRTEKARAPSASPPRISRGWPHQLVLAANRRATGGTGQSESVPPPKTIRAGAVPCQQPLGSAIARKKRPNTMVADRRTTTQLGHGTETDCGIQS